MYPQFQLYNVNLIFSVEIVGMFICVFVCSMNYIRKMVLGVPLHVAKELAINLSQIFGMLHSRAVVDVWLRTFALFLRDNYVREGLRGRVGQMK
jgi:hypothetical protein